TPSLASFAPSPAVPQPKSGARPVAAAARTLVTYCSSGTSSILIWTALPLFAVLKLSIICCQTSPSEAESQLQWTSSTDLDWAAARPGRRMGADAASVTPAVAVFTNVRRVRASRGAMVSSFGSDPVLGRLDPRHTASVLAVVNGEDDTRGG